jgi:hypothetical protein
MNVKEINIYSGSFVTGSDSKITGSIIAAKWEVDPDDGKSLQLRVPAGTLADQTEDKIPFYFSASGQIGIGTKTPSEEVEVKSTSNKFKVNYLANLTCSTVYISASGHISASEYFGPIDGGTY